MSTCPHCGCEIEPEKRQRSAPQHRRYMALCAAAYAAWPEIDDFKPRSANHLRYWLECHVEGGYVVTKMVRINSTDPEKLYQLMRAFLAHSDDETLFIELDGNLLIEKKAKSIAFGEMSQSDFSALAQGVEAIIEITLGVSAEQLLKETATAA